MTPRDRLAALTAGGRFAGLTSRGRLAGVVAVLVVVSAGCTSESRLASGSARRAATSTVTVLAAASLTEPLTALARQYERSHNGVTVALSFGSSTTLAQQVAEGAPADVVAFAGTPALDLLPKDIFDNGGRATIARNTMEIATPADNPGRVRGLADLSIPSLDVVLCASTVPCGKAADTVLSRVGITPHVVSREVDVKATLAKVRLGEADAALVYHSDVVSAGDSVRGVPIAEAQNTTLDYPMVWLEPETGHHGLRLPAPGPRRPCRPEPRRLPHAMTDATADTVEAVARPHERGTAGTTRVGLLVPAGIAVALVAVPLLALLLRADWATCCTTSPTPRCCRPSGCRCSPR